MCASEWRGGAEKGGKVRWRWQGRWRTCDGREGERRGGAEVARLCVAAKERSGCGQDIDNWRRRWSRWRADNEHNTTLTLVATYSVMKPVSVPLGSAVLTLRASPKSATFRSQLALRSRLDGFRSRWMTSAEWSALSARSVCGTGASASVSARAHAVLDVELDEDAVLAEARWTYLVDEILSVVV